MVMAMVMFCRFNRKSCGTVELSRSRVSIESSAGLPSMPCPCFLRIVSSSLHQPTARIYFFSAESECLLASVIRRISTSEYQEIHAEVAFWSALEAKLIAKRASRESTNTMRACKEREETESSRTAQDLISFDDVFPTQQTDLTGITSRCVICDE